MVVATYKCKYTTTITKYWNISIAIVNNKVKDPIDAKISFEGPMKVHMI